MYTSFTRNIRRKWGIKINENEKEEIELDIEAKYVDKTEKEFLSRVTYAECIYILTPENKYCDKIKELSVLKICEIIKNLQKENEELKIKNNAIKRESEAYAEHMIRLDNELNLEKEKSKYEWIRRNCLSQELVNKLYIPIQKVKDKIENLKMSGGSDGKDNTENTVQELVIEALQDILDESKEK